MRYFSLKPMILVSFSDELECFPAVSPKRPLERVISELWKRLWTQKTVLEFFRVQYRFLSWRTQISEFNSDFLSWERSIKADSQSVLNVWHSVLLDRSSLRYNYLFIKIKFKLFTRLQILLHLRRVRLLRVIIVSFGAQPFSCAVEFIGQEIGVVGVVLAPPCWFRLPSLSRFGRRVIIGCLRIDRS